MVSLYWRARALPRYLALRYLHRRAVKDLSGCATSDRTVINADGVELTVSAVKLREES